MCLPNFVQQHQTPVIHFNFAKLYFSEYFTGITDNGCPTDSHFLCADNMTCIPYHNVCDISPDCPDETDETESCCKYNNSAYKNCICKNIIVHEGTFFFIRAQHIKWKVFLIFLENWMVFGYVLISIT